MSVIDFLFAVHNHQPVGNFGHVFEEAYNNCYKPQIDVLKAHPGVRVALHFTGPLLEWIEDNRPDYIGRIAALAERGQVEILSGGFYEPIICAIPEDDAIGQIAMMNEYIEKRFGQKPSGMWMAERVWDPNMPRIIAAAGLSYTLLDDTHFYYAGLGEKDMFGCWMTEKGGSPVAVFPIDKTLRYTIPFRLPDESVDHILRVNADSGADCVTCGDDGEKFGVWPGTHKWVYEERWLHNFYDALERNADRIRMTLFSEYLERNPPRGRIYLPTASYEEMMKWALPPEASVRLGALLEGLEREGRLDAFKPFLRGGLWDNFMARYDEANRMHKKMLHVSSKLAAAGEKIPRAALARARRSLYQGQCNCAYWHGLFGGLYLGNLRHAVHERLIGAWNIAGEAERKAKSWISAERLDFDKDGGEDIVIENPAMTAVIDPDLGGSVMEFDFRPARFCVTNTLTRRREAYHEEIIKSGRRADDPGRIVVYDRYPRRLFTERFMAPGVTLESLSTEGFDDLGDFAGGVYEIESVEKKKGSVRAILRREGHVMAGGEKRPLTVEKVYYANSHDARLAAEYTLTNDGAAAIDLDMGIELNFTLLAGDADDRYWVFEGTSARPRMRDMGINPGVRRIGARDDFFGFEIKIESSDPADFYRYPVETVSRSEAGIDRTYQGSCVVAIRRIHIGPAGSLKFSIALSVEKIK